MNATLKEACAVLLPFWMAVLPVQAVKADPCGMVPPIHLAGAAPIERIGVQKTYVFFKNGIETFVIRPGYRGKVEEFGMLIPFPSPPSIRKVADDVFAHLGAAVDPPEVTVDLRWRRGPMFFGRAEECRADAAPVAESKLALDSVRVLREEAVGMYEVAVLEAGSAGALQRWMDDHGYRYPDGMDRTCQDYVAQKWCFVAVKTRVAAKRGVDARPGMRKVDTDLPHGATFDGHVQAMGFRFETDDLVLPMRLSAFNKGELRNVIYLLGDRPLRARQLPPQLVVRQVPGWQLHANLTQPLPLRILGGAIEDIPQWRRQSLKTERDPGPHNGIAKELFAADLLAARQGKLVHAFEEAEKDLLRIGEELGLRGPSIDALIAAQLAAERERTTAAALADLSSMTMTVIDGDFPREVLARENLTFVHFAMPSGRNVPALYDAKVLGPRRASIVAIGGGWRRVLLFLALVMGFIVVRGAARRRLRPATVLGLLVAVWLLAGPAAAQGGAPAAADPTIAELVQQLSDRSRAAAAAAALTDRGREAIPHLVGAAAEGADVHGRGWAIVCLARIGGEDVGDELLAVQTSKAPVLVRTWAAAARVSLAADRDELLALAGLAAEMPALQRPLGQRLIAALAAADDGAWVEKAVVLAAQGRLQQVLGPALLRAGAGPLLGVMTSSADDNARRLAAGYLATLAQQGDAGVAAAVVDALRFDVEASRLPWHGGALFIPSLPWPKTAARALVGQLVRWHLWCDRRGDGAGQQQIHNNIRSLALANAAGYRSPGWQSASTEQWLRIWAAAAGRWELEAILEEQGVAADPRYRALLAR